MAEDKGVKNNDNVEFSITENTADKKDNASLMVKKKSIADEIFDWIESILFSIFAVVLVFTFIMRTADVKGDSMLPTLHERDRLIVSNLFYQPENKDIIILDANNIILTNKGKEDSLVKRIVATEGQEVNIDFSNGKVFVDGVEQIEPYINELTRRDAGGFIYPVVVPKDCVFVMGDNRNNSTDSRDAIVGFVLKEDIIGKVIFRVYPFNRIGIPN